MPKDGIKLQHFTAELVGMYYSADSTIGSRNKEIFYNSKYYSKDFIMLQDSVMIFSGMLTITDQLAFYSLEFSTYYQLSKFDTAQVVERHKNEIKIIQDGYLIFKESTQDTIMNLHKKDKLIQSNGKYYLNHFIDKNNWEIFQFEHVSANSYSINITNEQDRNKFIDSSDVWKPIFAPALHLSNKKFKDFVDGGGFRTKVSLQKHDH